MTWNRAASLAILFLFGAGVAAFVIGFGIEPGRLMVKRYALKGERIPSALDGVKIVVIADPHVGSPQTDLAALRRVVDRANGLSPDIVLLLGDYVIRNVLLGSFVDPEPIAETLGDLRARQGVYAVLGNHDWWHDGPAMTAALESNQIKVLENEAVAVPLPTGSLWLAGVADDSTRDPAPAATVAAIPQDAPIILFAHDPAIFPEVPHRVLLTLAGHTHGGQVYLPGFGALITPGQAPHRHAYGPILEEGKRMIVSGGIGTSILPVRFNMPPEILLITLQSGAS
ncbi:MAG: metallophosphoesterase, partial [Magnetospiraceae bacterium]